MSVELEHAAMYVSDLEGAREFFERYLGGRAGKRYRNESTGFTSYFLSFGEGEGHARLEIMWRPELGDAARDDYRMGYVHLAFSLGSEQAVDELTSCLADDGYEVMSGPRVTGDGYYESCVRGFEGNIIELTA